MSSPFEIAEAAIGTVEDPREARHHTTVTDLLINHCELCPSYDPAIPHCHELGCACSGTARFFTTIANNKCHCPRGHF